MCVPVALLGASLVGGLTMANIAVDDPGFALEPEYYARATRFDEEQSRRTQSARLGWSVRVAEFGAGAEPDGVVLALSERDGRPLTAARVSVVAFANARAARRFTVELTERAPGLYGARLPAPRAGLWELRVTARRASDELSTTLRSEWPTLGGG